MNTKPLTLHILWLNLFPVILLALLFCGSLFLFQHILVKQKSQDLLALLDGDVAKFSSSQQNQVLESFLHDFTRRNRLQSLSIYSENGRLVFSSQGIKHRDSYTLSTDYQTNHPALFQQSMAKNGNDQRPQSPHQFKVYFAISASQLPFSNLTLLIFCLCITVISLIVASFFALNINKNLINPILALSNSLHDFDQGKFTPCEISSNINELRHLLNNFNHSIESIHHSQKHFLDYVNKAVNELSSAARSVEDKNREMEKTTLNAVTTNTQKSEFLAHISHEIRTPMNGIIGFTDLLINSDLPVRQREQIFLIKASAVNLISIVNNILDFYSLEHGNLSTKYTKFNLRDCIEEAACSIIPTSENTHIILDISSDVPDIIESDPVRIRQILLNLLSNASKFTTDGIIMIRCTLTRAGDLFISIRDEGTGMPDSTVKTLFQPFKQHVIHKQHAQPSSGLGLSITHTIINQLEGEIGVKSIENRGSVFWLKLPITKPEYTPVTAGLTKLAIIDSNQKWGKSLAKQLIHLGYRCNIFTTIKQFQLQQTGEQVLFFAELTDKAGRQTILEKIKQATRIHRIIFVKPFKQSDSETEALSLPCRSQQLVDIIDKQSTPRHQADKLPEKTYPVHVLIAEDNKINQELICKQLKPITKKITIASDGKQALNQLNQTKFDLILMDQQMPFLNGDDLIKIIKQPGHINFDTPVIATTANAFPSKQKELISYGFDECLIKPILQSQLTEILELWCNQDFSDETVQDFVTSMLKRTSQDKSLAFTLFSKLFIELPQQLTQISTLLKKEEYPQAAEITHRLHGSARFCSLQQISLAAELLEHHLITQSTSELTKDFYLLKTKIEHFIALKEEILESINPPVVNQ